MSDRRSLKYFALNGSCFSVVNKCIYYILLLIFILSGVLHEGPDSLNLVIKTWYYVSWGSNKYHQLYPVLIEQNKNLIKLFSAQLAGILFWTLALSPQCIGILVAAISFRFESFLSRDFLELNQNWNLKISIYLKSNKKKYLRLSKNAFTPLSKGVST